MAADVGALERLGVGVDEPPGSGRRRGRSSAASGRGRPGQRRPGPLQGAVDRRRAWCRGARRSRRPSRPAPRAGSRPPAGAAGRRCIAATRARRRSARSAAAAAGSWSATSASGSGCSQATSVAGTSGWRGSSLAAARSAGSARRPRRPRGRQADVGRDAVQPGAHRCPRRVVPIGGPPRPQQRLLDGVLGVVQRAEHAVAEGEQLAPVGRQLVARCRVVMAGHAPMYSRRRADVIGRGSTATDERRAGDGTSRCHRPRGTIMTHASASPSPRPSRPGGFDGAAVARPSCARAEELGFDERLDPGAGARRLPRPRARWRRMAYAAACTDAPAPRLRGARQLAAQPGCTSP